MPPILVARRPGVTQRDRIWEYVRASWSERLPDFPIVESDDGDRAALFNKARAFNRAAAAAGDWDVAVLIDADIWPDHPDQVLRAIESARWTRSLCFAHNRWHALSEAGTEDVLNGVCRPNQAQVVQVNPNTFSSVFAVPRELWDLVGGFDERFTGWGWEDLAFMASCRATRGVERVPGRVFHLWHEPYAGWGNADEPQRNEELGRRYLAAGAREIMALVAERTA